MLSRVEKLLSSSSRMDLQIQLDREQLVYTNEDAVSGHVILRNEAQVNIAAITVMLSGSATSRLSSGKLTESHQLFKRVEQVFPPNPGSSWFTTTRSVAVGPGEHAFPFSIWFPQVSECYRGSPASNDKRATNKRKQHLLRKLPPSTGDSSTPGEIKYLLEATVRPEGFLSGSQKVCQNIQFHGISAISNPLHSLSHQHRVVCDGDPPDSLRPLTSRPEADVYDVDAKLTNGPILQLNKPISLQVEIRGIRGLPKEIVIHDFQSLLLETTDVRAWGSVENHTRSWIIQTMTNLRLPIVAAYDSQDGEVLRVNEGLWSGHRLPSYLAPTFETCNVTRSYALVIRFGIEFGANNMRIVEFQFPAYIISSGTNLPRGTSVSTDSPGDKEKKKGKEVTA